MRRGIVVFIIGDLILMFGFLLIVIGRNVDILFFLFRVVIINIIMMLQLFSSGLGFGLGLCFDDALDQGFGERGYD